MVCFYSDDEGETWSGPFKWFAENRNSTPETYLWTGFLKAGPGHAIQLKSGDHKGRILVGCDHKYQIYDGKSIVENSEDEDYYGSHIAYSDDNGESWHMLELNEELHYGNECIPVELSDGRVYLRARGDGLAAVEKAACERAAEVLGIENYSLAEGRPADIVIFDPARKYVIDADKFKSNSRNTPFNGREVVCKVCATLVGGKVVYREA